MARQPYSVLISLYAKESPEYLKEALDSMLAQTVEPAQIVIVKDGELTPDLDAVCETYASMYPGLFDFIEYPENKGLGYALSKGIPACKHELIARMDSDDWANPKRIEIQLEAFEQDPDLDMLGTQVYEFVATPDEPITLSHLPLELDDIIKYSKRRNPFRHTPMMYKKSKVLEAGNYSSDYLYFEDWDLFNRMLSRGCKGQNIDLPLLHIRVSSDFFSRRGGPAYLGYVWRFKTSQVKRGYFSLWDFACSFFPHMVVCLMPNKLRSLVYEKTLRKNVGPNSENARSDA